ncbi:alpha/beta hydrolase [Streptomyces sp. NPDC001833]|uniref:alpha/beta fold hydrolase n=1 Tax=Streptomyces sp. NPDC001833 TaxID=3154658 RepID=UPI00332F933A
MSIYVLVHGGCHNGDHFEATASYLRSEGHEVLCPTLHGNRPGDSRGAGLEEAAQSLVDYFLERNLKDVVLVGHSLAGFAISAAADRLPEGSIRRLVYYAAVVPFDGEGFTTMETSPAFAQQMAELVADDGGIVIPFDMLREMYINDGTVEQAKALAESLVPQPIRTLTDTIKLSKTPAEFPMGKSVLRCTEDTTLAGLKSAFFAERLGLYRLVSMPGSHSTHFTNPELLASKLLEAGRD